MPPVRIGLTLPQIGRDYAEVLAIAREAERSGFDGVFLFDHLWPIGARHRSILECWTTLAALTAATERIRVGTLVTRVTIRHPALLAKMAATVDRIGGGRLILGLGAGDDLNRAENAAYGLPFHEAPDRAPGLSDTIAILDRMWRERDPSFVGALYQIDGATLEPKPVQQPRPPIWVGGRSPAARRVAAARADGWNLWGGSAETFADDVADLLADARAVGRDPADLTPTWAGNVIVAPTSAEVAATVERWRPKNERAEVYRGQIVAGRPEEVIKGLRRYLAAGAQWLIVDFPGLDKRPALRRFADHVLPALHGRPAGGRTA